MGKEALGYEEMIKRDRESRRPKPVSKEVTITEGKSEPGISREPGTFVDKEIEMFSPPERAGFEQFYRDVNFTNIVSAKVENSILTLISPTYNISLNVRTIIEILAQKMNTPLSLPMELHIKSPPPFILNIKEVCNWWISQMLCEYQKIFCLNDPLIQKMCNEYFLSLSYPIVVRLAYLEWENNQMGWKIGLKVTEIEEETKKEVRKIKADYDKLLDSKTTAMKTEMNKLQMENKELWTRIDIMNERLANLRQDKDNQAGAVQETHIKLKAEQERILHLEKEIIKLNDEKKLMERLIEKDEEVADWKPDVTSTPEIPVYRNKKLGKVLVFPSSMDQFKQDYKLKGQDGSLCIYEKDDGTRFELPDTLADELVTTEVKPSGTKNKSGREQAKLLQDNPKWKEIIEFIESFDGDPSTPDIAEGVNVNPKNIRRQYLKVMEDNGLLIGEQFGKEKRYSLP